MSISAKIALAALVAAAPAMATDFTATGTFSDGTTRYVRIATGDVDGDGVSDDGVIKLVCSGGSISSASIYAPRDMATGQASGKRMHKPFVFTKELDVSSKDATPLKGTYDLKSGTKRGTPGTASWDLATNKGGRSNKTMAMDDWSEITVTKLDQVCAAGTMSSLVSNPAYHDSGMSGTMPSAERTEGGALPRVKK